MIQWKIQELLQALRGKQRAKQTEIPVWGPEALPVEPAALGLRGSPTRVIKIFHPSVARTCEKISATDDAGVDEATDRLIELLRTKAAV